MMFQKGASPIENPVKPKAAFLHVLVFFEAKVLMQKSSIHCSKNRKKVRIVIQ